MRAFFTTLFVVAIVLTATVVGSESLAQPPDKRIALLTRNGGYKNVDCLTNPANDANLMAKTVQAAGFTLIGWGAKLHLDKSHASA